MTTLNNNNVNAALNSVEAAAVKLGGYQEGRGYARWAGIAGAVTGGVLSVIGGKNVVSAAAGAAVGAAGGYLVGNMFDEIGISRNFKTGELNLGTEVAVDLLIAGLGLTTAIQTTAAMEYALSNTNTQIPE